MRMAHCLLRSNSLMNVEGTAASRSMQMKSRCEQLYRVETGAMGYILLWVMGVPASVLFLIFLVRGCQ